MDQLGATMSALTGDRDRDWDGFAATYRKVTSQLPANTARRQEVSAATVTGMIASLDDNHARWNYQPPLPGYVPGDSYGLGSPPHRDTR